MTRHMKTGLIPAALLFIFSNSIAQSSTFNQNSSRSNNTRAYNQNSARSNHPKMISSGFDFQLSPQYGINMKGANTDSLLFRGNGPGFKMDAGYSFGNFGIGMSSGFVSSQTDKTKINEFLSRSGIPVDQMLISTGNQQNMYVLLGPNASFGNKIRALLHAKAGMFINNGGFVNIKRQGAVNSVYRNEPSSKSVFPGFTTGASLNYHVSDMISVGFGADYLTTKSEVVNYDIRRGAAIEGLKLSKTISSVMAGLIIKYNIQSPRENASGQSSGKINAQFNPKEYTVSKNQSGLNNARGPRQSTSIDGTYNNMSDRQSCGPVTKSITHPDGTKEEMTFSCPEDAANYARQTPKRDFGERNFMGNNPGDVKRTYAVPHVFEQKGTISGRVSWTSPATNMGIVTNKSVRGGGIRFTENQGATRTTPNSSFGTMVRLVARESGSGMATGRRQYEPVFMEGQGSVCNPCLVTINNNPLYQEPGTKGDNALYQGHARVTNPDWADLSPAIEGLAVSLVDISSGSVVAVTQTEKDGNFFFANVPYGAYAVRLSGTIAGKKGYDFYMKSRSEMEGDIVWSGETVQLLINTDATNDNPAMKAGISTSRSNIRTKNLTIIDADTDGDGSFDSFRAIGICSDGTSIDNTEDASASRVNKVDAFTIKQKAFSMSGGAYNPSSSRLSITGIIITRDGNGNLKATTSFSDGSSWDVTNTVEVRGWDYKMKQYSITVADLDDDGICDAVANRTKSRSNIQNNRLIKSEPDDEPLGVVKTKTKSNQSNDRMSSGTGEESIWSPRSNIDLYKIVVGDLDGDGKAEEATKITKSRSNIQNNRIMIADLDDDGVPEAAINTSHSNIKNLLMFTGDLDGDGRSDLKAGLVGGMLPGGAVISAALKPGDPIPGLDVKIKKKSGGNEKNIAGDENGRIRVIGPDMEPDTYIMTVSTNIYIEDETLVIVGGNANDIAIDEEGVQRSSGIKQTMQTQVKWAATEPTKAAINTSHSNIKNMLLTLDEIEQMLNADQVTAKAIINTSRSNIKNQRAAIDNLEETLTGLETMDKSSAISELNSKMSAMNMQFLALQESLNAAGRQYTTVSNVLKTKHDTVKNSINNVR